MAEEDASNRVNSSEETADEKAVADPESKSSSASAASVPTTNITLIQCTFCPSKILIPGTARHMKRKVFLPSMSSKSSLPDSKTPVLNGSDANDALYVLPDVPGETLEDFWIVQDMYAFDNVGVSRQVGSLKYLICADCERGPIGYWDTTIKNEFLVAWDRVRFEK